MIKGYEKFFPTFLAKDAIGWLIGFALLVYLAVVSPWEIGVKADPLASAPLGIKPEWYFWAQFQLLKDFTFPKWRTGCYHPFHRWRHPLDSCSIH